MKGKRLIAALVVLVLCIGGYFLVKSLDLEKVKEENPEYMIQVDSSEITNFSFVRDGQTLSFTKTEDTWNYDGDGSLTMNQTSMKSMAAVLAEVEAKQILTEHEELSEYGLDSPSNTITFTAGGETKTILVGNENKAASGVYVKMDGDDTVYLISETLPNKFDCGLDTLEETEAETSESEIAETESGESETAAESGEAAAQTGEEETAAVETE